MSSENFENKIAIERRRIIRKKNKIILNKKKFRIDLYYLCYTNAP
jgi:hypothetical protein